MPNEDKIGLRNGLRHRFCIGLPFDTMLRFATGKKRIDENDGFADVYFPTGVAEPFENHGFSVL
jgi:hypothetical protein